MRIPSAIALARLADPAKVVLALLAREGGDECSGLEDLLRQAGMTRRPLHQRLLELEEAGWLEVERRRGWGRCNLMRVRLPAGANAGLLVPRELLELVPPGLSPSLRWAWWVVADATWGKAIRQEIDPFGWTRLDTEQLARVLGIAPRQMRARLSSLVGLGLVEADPFRFGVYRLPWASGVEEPTAPSIPPPAPQPTMLVMNPGGGAIDLQAAIRQAFFCASASEKYIPFSVEDVLKPVEKGLKSAPDTEKSTYSTEKYTYSSVEDVLGLAPVLAPVSAPRPAMVPPPPPPPRRAGRAEDGEPEPALKPGKRPLLSVRPEWLKALGLESSADVFEALGKVGWLRGEGSAAPMSAEALMRAIHREMPLLQPRPGEEPEEGLLEKVYPNRMRDSQARYLLDVTPWSAEAIRRILREVADRHRRASSETGPRTGQRPAARSQAPLAILHGTLVDLNKGFGWLRGALREELLRRTREGARPLPSPEPGLPESAAERVHVLHQDLLRLQAKPGREAEAEKVLHHLVEAAREMLPEGALQAIHEKVEGEVRGIGADPGSALFVRAVQRRTQKAILARLGLADLS